MLDFGSRSGFELDLHAMAHEHARLGRCRVRREDAGVRGIAAEGIFSLLQPEEARQSQIPRFGRELGGFVTLRTVAHAPFTEPATLCR